MAKQMTAHEFAAKYRIGFRKVNQIVKDGWLPNVSAPDSRPAKMARYLSSQRPLSVIMLLEALREPGLVMALGRYESQARDLLAAIGDPASGALPAGKEMLILGASMNDLDSLNELADWAKSVIPANGCGYHWLAVRALWNCTPDRFKAIYSRLPSAMMKLRSIPGMSPWTETVDGAMRFIRAELEFDL